MVSLLFAKCGRTTQQKKPEVAKIAYSNPGEPLSQVMDSDRKNELLWQENLDTENTLDPDRLKTSWSELRSPELRWFPGMGGMAMNQDTDNKIHSGSPENSGSLSNLLTLLRNTRYEIVQYGLNYQSSDKDRK
ncbi:hypothetical protein ACFL52_02965 [Candidatus Margulisiibacteriota bacterium]